MNDIANFVKNYEADKPKQHLVYISPGGVTPNNCGNPNINSSGCDWHPATQDSIVNGRGM